MNPYTYDIYHGLHNELQAALEQNQAQSVVDTAGKAGLEGLLHEPDNTNPEANLSPEQLEQVDLIREQF